MCVFILCKNLALLFFKNKVSSYPLLCLISYLNIFVCVCVSVCIFVCSTTALCTL